ncbi:MAG: ATP-dependent sacrificial sulfur transferase LarE [Kofleriaceae bacterium]|nr:ATP-dependent sacrificial sulfur transferase LarE [Kofleriaceae bacterium]
MLHYRLAVKLQALQDNLRQHQKVLVAFSGGVDSTFLLKVAQDVLAENCFAITCVSVTMARSEVEDARVLGQELGLGERHFLVDSNELQQPGFASNPTDRCALCKTESMDLATPLAARLGNPVILLGTNTDDLGDYRPGIAAASKRGSRAPMVEAEMSKADVRRYSQELGLRTWDKPQLACLSSRFPYGTTITAERLSSVDRFEDGLRALGFSQLRVRFHDTIARVELVPEELPRACQPEIRDAMVALGKSVGFTYVAVDLAGFRSGSLNETPLLQISKRSALSS